MSYLWHGQPCEVLVRAPYVRRIKRNCLVQLEGRKVVVPCRALRRPKNVDSSATPPRGGPVSATPRRDEGRGFLAPFYPGPQTGL